METKFLAKKSTDKQRIIYFNFNTDYSKVLVSTGLTISNNDWGKGYPKKTASTKEMRNTLNNWKGQIDDFISDIVKKEQRQPTKFELTSFINSLLGKNTTSSLLSDLINDYLTDCKVKFAESTYSKKEQHLKHFKAHVKNREVKELSSKQIKDYQRKVDQLPNELATINTYIKNVKAFLNWIYKGEHTTENYGKYLKKHKLSDKQVIALTDAEFEVIETAEMRSQRHQKVVDIFLFGCYTGLRFGDIQGLQKENINNSQIELRQNKTGDIIRIPLINEAIELLEKYKWKLPTISNQKGNVYLKEAFYLLKLTRKVTVSTQHVNGINDEVKQLNEAITFHKARKTFITIALLRGVPAHVVKRLSGHKTDAVFQKYIAYTDEVLASEISKLSRSARHLKAV